MEIVKGQKIWVWRDRIGIEETTVKSVGRKYITINDPWGTKFYRDTLKQVDEYGLEGFLITDIEEYNREQFYRNSRSKLSRINWNKVSCENIDKILEILKL